MAKKTFKYTELKRSVKYSFEGAIGTELDEDQLAEITDNLIEELGLNDKVDYDEEKEDSSGDPEELEFDE
jgi:hypothetical protein